MSGLLTKTIVRKVWERTKQRIEADLRDQYNGERTQLAVRMGFVGNPEVFFADAIGEVWDEKGEKYANIATCKFGISSRTGKRTRDVRASELLPGETVFYGSEVIDNIVIGTSGAMPFDDEKYASWFAADLRAEAERLKHELEQAGEIWLPS